MRKPPPNGLRRPGRQAVIVACVHAKILLTVVLGALASATPHFSAGASAAGIFKCRDSGAQPIYQGLPCPPGRELRNFEHDPPTVSVIPFERGASAVPATRAPARKERPPRALTLQERRKAEADRRRNELDIAERRHLKEGMSDGEVLAKLGPPDLQSGKTGRKLRWTYLPAAGDPQTVTLVRFEDGRVVGVERSTLR